ncbi:hypothetical protein LSAT2_021590, partial [Lamellibrachia satsuma]
QQVAEDQVVGHGCSLRTLRREANITRCFTGIDKLVDISGSDVAETNTRCIVRCGTGQMTYRLCDDGGYWTGPRLNCHHSQQG